MKKKKSTLQELPEYLSIESFVEFLLEEEREEFTAEEMKELAYHLRRADIRGIRRELEAYGLELRRRSKERRTRGFKTSSHDRWYGPGSCPTHGGSGFDNRE